MNKKFTALTVEEKKKVEDNIAFIETVIKNHISINRNINGLGYDDLIQVGSIGLCKAVQTFNGSVLFETYASKVIKNHLIDHCRNVLRSTKHMVLSDDQKSFEIIDSSNTEFEDVITDMDISKLFYEVKQKYTGCVLKGIEALELKINGYSGREIADMYGINPNLVGAWISKAVKQLKCDKKFMKQFQSEDEVESLSS